MYGLGLLSVNEAIWRGYRYRDYSEFCSNGVMVSIALSLFNMRIWCKNSGFYEIYKMIDWMGTIED